MIKPENDIKRFFERLGLKMSIQKLSDKNPARAKRHVLEYTDGNIHPERFVTLMHCYFDDVRSLGFARCSVLLSEFKPDVKYPYGICRRCGCSNNDACPDPQTGSCWWVLEDVCSACATPEEKQVAIDEMKGLSKEENND